MAVAWYDWAGGTKWLKHYSSAQNILIVGDGDFSFSLALATAFGSGANLVATSLDSYAELNTKYSDATSNVTKLEAMGATVLHGVDVKDMNLHANLQLRWFDRIVFNFPHAGFNGREDEVDVIKSHQELVRSFFATARHMIWRHGEIHVTHKTKHPFSMWGIEQLASEFSLVMVEQAAFQIQDYPGYNHKRGSSWRCDQNFAIGDCSTFKFRLF
ncbi:heavy metal-associated isoprenylated plant protein 41-like [Hordeum vulgare subsp. vulgare]|uniref:heavy metal-associated isoprenylated plant protein 41-like n=1 Tax=Hordeum vulgare subsp. vulgare TaxID=112509 RepID=UPI001D1A4781|nr:heavy metal-associated isoprenylated plant protein 41-like [Hordeum vulgare subsp. vulgare]